MWLIFADGLQFLTFENPIKVILSDKYTSIPATIASGAVSAFKKQYRKGITERTQGSVIQLLQFEIVVTHLGEPAEQLTLLVQKFKHLGSDGSGIFGDPKPITENGSLRTLLAELTDFRNRQAAKRRVNQNGLEHYFSHSEGSITESDDGSDNSQREFATQKPKCKAKNQMPKPLTPMDGLQEIRELKRPRTGDNAGQESLLHHKLPELDYTASPAARRPSRDDIAEAARRLGASRTAGINSPTSKMRSLNTNADLIALVKNKRGGRSIDVNKTTSVKDRKDSALPNGFPASVLAAPGRSEVADIDSIINEAAVAAQSTLRGTSGSPKDSRRHGTSLCGLKNAQTQRAVPEVDGKFEAQTNLGQLQRLGHNQVAGDSTINPMAKQELLTIEDVQDPWQGMTFIRKKEKYIPANQEKLLNRKDCWLPPEPGERAPVSNIPLEILQSLTGSVECTTASTDDDSQSANKRRKISQKDKSYELSQKSSSCHGSDEEDEEEAPFASSEWPSSPPAPQKSNELPPDSSVEVLSPVKLGISREVKAFGTAGRPEDLMSQNSISTTSSPVHEASSMDQSPRSFTGSLINQELGCDFTGKNQTLLQPASVHVENGDALQDSKHLDGAPIKDEATKLASSPPFAKQPGMETVNLDSDTADSNQSDLEMAVPNALQSHDIIAYGNERQQTPSRSHNNRNSTLQVHRTPYTVHHQRVKGNSDVLKMDTLPLKNQPGKRNVEENQVKSALDDGASIQVMVPRTFSQSDRAKQGSADVDTIKQLPEDATTAINFDYVSGNPHDITEPNPVTADISSAASRKRQVELGHIISTVTKRRKHIQFAGPGVEDDGDGEKPREDPSTRARQLRREFMKNLRAMSRASAAPPSLLPSDVDIRGPSVPMTNPDMDSDILELDGHSVKQDWSSERPKGPRAPDSTTSPKTSSPIKRMNVFSPRGHDHAAKSLAAISPQAPPSSYPGQHSILETFRKAYPEYRGNEKQFVALCRKIGALVKENRMLHKSLWDDFVIRHQQEYREHLARCAEEAEDPMPYETFYSAEIDEPKFMKRILSPANLKEAISLGTPAQKQSAVQVNPVSKTTIDLTQITPEPQVPEQSQPRSSSKSAVASTHSAPSQGFVQANKGTLSLSEPLPSSITRKTPRTLPWSTADSSTPTPASQRHQNLNTSNTPLVLSPASSSKNPLVAPRGVNQPVAANSSVTAPFPTAPQGAPPVISSTAKSTPSRKGKEVVGRRDNRDAILSATAAPTLSSTKGISSTKPSSSSNISQKQETTSSRGPRPSATPSKPWYLDPVNPFKQFARAYASVTSGADNAFVEEKDRQKKGRPVVVNEDGVVMADVKEVDVLGWHL